MIQYFCLGIYGCVHHIIRYANNFIMEIYVRTMLSFMFYLKMFCWSPSLRVLVYALTPQVRLDMEIFPPHFLH